MKKPLTKAYRREYDNIVENVRRTHERASMEQIAETNDIFFGACFRDEIIFRVALAEITYNPMESVDEILLVSAFYVFIQAHLQEIDHVIESVLSESFPEIYQTYCNYKKVVQAQPIQRDPIFRSW